MSSSGGGSPSPAAGSAGTNEHAFPIRLHEMIQWVEENHPNSPAPVYWLEHGRAFVINDQKTFASTILPNFFKQVKIESFTRKLNRWGFTLIKSGPDKGAYQHDNFVRWEVPHAITSMPPEKKRSKKTSNTATTSSSKGAPSTHHQERPASHQDQSHSTENAATSYAAAAGPEPTRKRSFDAIDQLERAEFSTHTSTLGVCDGNVFEPDFTSMLASAPLQHNTNNMNNFMFMTGNSNNFDAFSAPSIQMPPPASYNNDNMNYPTRSGFAGNINPNSNINFNNSINFNNTINPNNATNTINFNSNINPNNATSTINSNNNINPINNDGMYSEEMISPLSIFDANTDALTINQARGNSNNNYHHGAYRREYKDDVDGVDEDQMDNDLKLYFSRLEKSMRDDNE